MIIQGDALHIPLPDCSVDSIVTDPPYGLKFMGKKWDHGVPGVEFWIEALRVAKPGAHMLAFGGTRTHHRLTCAIEDAGWEIRDCIMWVYGSGFPKSLDVSKAIDKMAGKEPEFVCMRPDSDGRERWKDKAHGESTGFSGKLRVSRAITRSVTEAAKQWDGWGSALKPAYEPIILARKPLDGTIAQNVLKWGCGGINIDGSRIETELPSPRNAPKKIIRGGNFHFGSEADKEMSHYNPTLGRFPANFIHDGSDEVVSLFPVTTSGSLLPHHKTHESENRAMSGKNYQRYLKFFMGSSCSAARFFFCAKASKVDRDEGVAGVVAEVAGCYSGRHNGSLGSVMMSKNVHPTVKPTSLMRYLCKLITPPNGIVLDQFCGSGSTGKAAIKEGFRFIGIEKEMEYCRIAKARCEYEARKPNQMRMVA